MKLGFVTAILPEMEFADIVKFASQEDYECVEVMCWPSGKAERRYAGITHIDVMDFTQNDADKINELLEDEGVEISGMGFYPNALAPDAEEAAAAVEHIKRVIVATKMLGLTQMNSFIGRDWTKNVDDNWPRFVETWTPIIQFAEDQGVRIGIENCPMFFSNDEWPSGKNLAHTPAIWARMFEAIPNKNFGLNYDPSHLVWQHMDYLKPMRDFADRIFHVHAKDVRIDRHKLDQVGILATPLEFHSPKLPGLGDVDWGQFFSVLGDTGYDGPVCVEVEDRAYEATLETRKQALRQSAMYLRQFIPSKDTL